MNDLEYVKIRVDHIRGLKEGDLIQFCSKNISRNSKDRPEDMITCLVVDIPRFTGRYTNLIDVLIPETKEVRTIHLSWNKIWKLVEIETKEQ